MIRPLLEYGNAMWGPVYLGDVHKVEKIQRRATKMKNLPETATPYVKVAFSYLPTPQGRHDPAVKNHGWTCTYWSYASVHNDQNAYSRTF